MKKKYLTKEKKEYYQTELLKAVNCTDPDWDLDEGLKDILFKINNNPNIQTILSKRTDKINYGNINSCASYLHVSITKEFENKLKLIAKAFEKKFTSDYFELVVTTGPFNTKWDEKMDDMDAVNNVPKYTDITMYMFYFTHDDLKEHNLFWDEIKSKLIWL
jgi:hypothetical protein